MAISLRSVILPCVCKVFSGIIKDVLVNTAVAVETD